MTEEVNFFMSLSRESLGSNDVVKRYKFNVPAELTYQCSSGLVRVGLNQVIFELNLEHIILDFFGRRRIPRRGTLKAELHYKLSQ